MNEPTETPEQEARRAADDHLLSEANEIRWRRARPYVLRYVVPYGAGMLLLIGVLVGAYFQMAPERSWTPPRPIATWTPPPPPATAPTQVAARPNARREGAPAKADTGIKLEKGPAPSAPRRRTKSSEDIGEILGLKNADQSSSDDIGEILGLVPTCPSDDGFGRKMVWSAKDGICVQYDDRCSIIGTIWDPQVRGCVFGGIRREPE